MAGLSSSAGTASAMFKKCDDLSVARLREVRVELAHRVKRLWLSKHDDFVGFSPQTRGGARWCDRYRHDDAPCVMRPQIPDSSTQRETRGHAVVDEDHGAACHVQRRSAPAVSGESPGDLGLLRDGFSANVL